MLQAQTQGRFRLHPDRLEAQAAAFPEGRKALFCLGAGHIPKPAQDAVQFVEIPGKNRRAGPEGPSGDGDRPPSPGRAIELGPVNEIEPGLGIGLKPVHVPPATPMGFSLLLSPEKGHLAPNAPQLLLFFVK